MIRGGTGEREKWAPPTLHFRHFTVKPIPTLAYSAFPAAPQKPLLTHRVLTTRYNDLLEAFMDYF